MALVHAQPAQSAVPNDADGGIGGLIAGSGILLIQACVVIPALLPVLLLLIVCVLPLVVLAAAVGLLIAVPVFSWRLARATIGPPRKPRRPQESVDRRRDLVRRLAVGKMTDAVEYDSPVAAGEESRLIL